MHGVGDQRHRVERDGATDLDDAQRQRQGQRDPQRPAHARPIGRRVAVAVVGMPVVMRHEVILTARYLLSPYVFPNLSYAAGI